MYCRMHEEFLNENVSDLHAIDAVYAFCVVQYCWTTSYLKSSGQICNVLPGILSRCLHVTQEW